jgi:hypothetical protein
MDSSRPRTFEQIPRFLTALVKRAEVAPVQQRLDLCIETERLDFSDLALASDLKQLVADAVEAVAVHLREENCSNSLSHQLTMLAIERLKAGRPNLVVVLPDLVQIHLVETAKRDPEEARRQERAIREAMDIGLFCRRDVKFEGPDETAAAAERLSARQGDPDARAIGRLILSVLRGEESKQSRRAFGLNSRGGESTVRRLRRERRDEKLRELALDYADEETSTARLASNVRQQLVKYERMRWYRDRKAGRSVCPDDAKLFAARRACEDVGGIPTERTIVKALEQNS